MQVNSLSNYVAQPSFGMARLSSKGRAVAKEFVEELPKFLDSKPYVKKNLLKKTLKRKPSVEAINDLFKFADTKFADKNAQFVERQILPMTGYSKIKKFIVDNKSETSGLSDLGMALVDSLKKVFDDNISNPYLSSKKGKKILDLIKDYLPIEDISSRIAVVSDRLLSK